MSKKNQYEMAQLKDTFEKIGLQSHFRGKIIYVEGIIKRFQDYQLFRMIKKKAQSIKNSTTLSCL